MPFLHQIAEIKDLVTDTHTNTIPPLMRMIQHCHNHQEKNDTPLDEKHTAHRIERELRENATNTLTIAEAEAFAFLGNHTARNTGTSVVTIKRNDDDEDDDIKRICQQTWTHALADAMTRLFGCNVYAVRRYPEIEWTFYGIPVATRQAAQTFENFHTIIQQEAREYYRVDVEIYCLGVVDELLKIATGIQAEIHAEQNTDGLHALDEATTDEHVVSDPTLLPEDTTNHSVLPLTGTKIFNCLWPWLQNRLKSIANITQPLQLILVNEQEGDTTQPTILNSTSTTSTTRATAASTPQISPTPILTPTLTPSPRPLTPNPECTIQLMTTFTLDRKHKIDVTNPFQTELDRYKPKRSACRRTVRITNVAVFEEGRMFARETLLGRIEMFMGMAMDA